MKRKPAEKRLHAPCPDYFTGSDSLLPPGMLANTTCGEESTEVAEDPDAVTCDECKRFMVRFRQYYNFLRARWIKKRAGTYLRKTHGE